MKKFIGRVFFWIGFRMVKFGFYFYRVVNKTWMTKGKSFGADRDKSVYRSGDAFVEPERAPLSPSEEKYVSDMLATQQVKRGGCEVQTGSFKRTDCASDGGM